MGVTQWQCDGEDGTSLAVSTVMCLDGSVMHVDNHLTEVQPNARTLDVETLGILALIETVEDMLQAVLVESDTVVDNTKHGLVGLRCQTDDNFAILVSVLESIRQEVRHNLIELAAVYPSIKMLQAATIEAEVEMTLLCAILEHLTDAADKGHQFCFLTMQMHLLLVYLTDIEYLVDKIEDALRITLNGIDWGF